MQFRKKVTLIQGGMGVYVSNWRLAQAVAMESPGETAGTVSGLLACVGLGQGKDLHGEYLEEAAIVTLGNDFEGIRRLSRQGQSHY